MERAVLKVLKTHKKFLISMHVNPDPDAIGSAIAMALYLKSIGKAVRVVNETPCPQWLDFMPRTDLYETVDECKKFVPEVAIILDCGELERIGKVATLITPKTEVVNIDHHVTNTRFGKLNIVRDHYSSTSEILYEILKQAKCVFTRDMAILLYLGILTDTGSFGFDCTRSHTHAVIADLMRIDLPVSDLYRQVYETMPKMDLKPFLKLMSTLTLHDDERVACLTMTKKQMSCFSDEFDVKDKIFSFLRSVKGLEVIVILTEQDKKKTRLNFRSRGDFDVSRLASRFNGGGHKKASGGYLDVGMIPSKKKILSAIGAQL
jgi:bifunctional oligoribonuclease and PAP phosphatase NrnA